MDDAEHRAVDAVASSQIPGLPPNLSFEEALATLEETVEELRSDGLSLARALDLYERGARLSAYCEHLLTTAELRLTRLDAASGSLSAPEVVARQDEDTRPRADF